MVLVGEFEMGVGDAEVEVEDTDEDVEMKDVDVLEDGTRAVELDDGEGVMVGVGMTKVDRKRWMRKGVWEEEMNCELEWSRVTKMVKQWEWNVE